MIKGFIIHYDNAIIVTFAPSAGSTVFAEGSSFKTSRTVC